MRLKNKICRRLVLVVLILTTVVAGYRSWHQQYETNKGNALFSESIDCPHCTENWAFLELLQSRLFELSRSEMLSDVPSHTQVDCTWKLRFNGDHRCVDSSCPISMAPRLSRTNIDSIRKPVLEFGGNIRESVEYHFELGLNRNQFVFLTAASSEYFNQSQAAIRRLHEHVFPYISNYTFYYYDLGLTETERNLVQQSGAVLKKYPCGDLPERLRHVTCMTWKPLIIQAHFNEGDYVVWLDSSVRILNDIRPLFSKVEKTGILIEGGETQFPQYVAMDMFSYFGDSPCQFSSHSEVKSRFMIFHNDLFTRNLIMDPWVACALDPDCMCTEQSRPLTFCDSEVTEFGKCHRYDQSALGYILIKLFRDFVPSVHIQLDSYHQVGRGEDFYLHELQHIALTRNTTDNVNHHSSIPLDE